MIGLMVLCLSVAVVSAVSVKQQTDAAVAAPRKVGDAGCSLCVTAVSFAEGWVNQNDTEAAIAKKLDGLCAITGQFKQSCDAIVQGYLPQIIQYLEAQDTPQEVCDKLKLCKKTATIAAPVVVPAVVKSVGGGFCSICESAVALVESYVESNTTLNTIEQNLDQYCKLTGPYASLCDSLVSSYLPQLVSYIEQDYTPEEACDDIGLCSALKAKAATAVAPAKVGGGGTCSICESVVSLVETYVESNQTVAKIESQLAQLCALTGQYATMCDNLVDNYVPQLISYVEQDYTPEEACTDIGICSAVQAQQQQQASQRVNAIVNAQ